MIRPRFATPTVVGLASMVVAAVTATALVLALPAEPPATLATAAPATTAAVTYRTDADERPVQVELETGAPRTVVTSRAGTVTSSNCTTGGTIAHGDAIATVDGVPVLALATSVPLWRELRSGDRGDDVRALQEALGGPLRTDGVVGAATLRAAHAFLIDHGLERASVPRDSIDPDHVAWIPASTVTTQRCTAVVGAALPDDGVLAELPSELRSARLQRLPDDAVPGDRVLRFGPSTAHVRPDGVVDDPRALRGIESLTEYRSTVNSADGVPTMTASWSLAEPLRVGVVPPTALWDVAENEACVLPSTSGPVRVRVIGSELGQAFIRADDLDGGRLASVRTDPDRTATCR
jgi:hypothetical protein